MINGDLGLIWFGFVLFALPFPLPLSFSISPSLKFKKFDKNAVGGILSTGPWMSGGWDLEGVSRQRKTLPLRQR